MSELTKEEQKIFDLQQRLYGYSSYEEENPPEKLNVPRPNYGSEKSFPDYYEYYKPYALDLFIKKATKVLKETGSLDEVKDKNYNSFNFAIEAEILGKGGVYEEVFEYGFDSEANELIKRHLK
jgi:hypothetical protein